MLNLEVTTTRSSERVLEQARGYFGGLGFEEAEAPGGVAFRSTGGYVQVSVADSDGQTSVSLVADEFEHDARQFARSLTE